MTYQAIVLDMDGTMLNERNQVSEGLQEALKELRRRGLNIFIATGRTMQEVSDVLPAGLEVDGIVTANGMAVYVGGKQLVRHELSPQLVRELVEKARSREIYYEVHPTEGRRIAMKEDEAYFLQHVAEPKPETVENNEWFSRKNALKEKIVWKDSLDDAESVAKIYFFSRNMASIEEWKGELETLRQKTPFAIFSSSDHNVEVMVADVSKATGLRYLLDTLGLAGAQILAVGDGENDLPMFRLATHAVAMRNAPDVVKEQADEVTECSYRVDGLCFFLRKAFEL